MKWSRQAAQKMVESVEPSHIPTPFSLRTQLAECAEHEPSELPSRIVDTLEGLRRNSLTPDQRFPMIELCGNAASHLRRGLDHQSPAGLAPPLRDNEVELSSRCAETYWMIGQCYKNVMEDLISRGGRDLTNAAYLLHACYQGMANLGEYLLIDYERYAKVRKGVWLDIHRFYSVAHSKGLQDIQAEAHGDRLFSTIEHVYKRILLLGLSDPFHHPPGGPSQIYSRLDRWARLAYLTTIPPDSGRCSFIVNPEVDRPAMPTLPQTVIQPQLNEKCLVTRSLVDTLKTQHRRATKIALKRVERCEAISQELGSIELLRRLIVNWAIHPIRHTTRTRTYKSCDVVAGVKSVCIVLNGFKPLLGKKNGTSRKLVNVMKRALTWPPSEFDDFSWTVNTWSIEDEHEQGWRLGAAAPSAAGRLRVGELVAIRSGYDWQIGSVRWAQHDDGNKLRLGVRKIMGSARPALARRLPIQESRARGLEPALLLVDRTDDGHTYSLLCDKRLYLPMGVYRVRLAGQKDHCVFQSTDVRLSSRSFVWFEVRRTEDEMNSPPAV